MGLTESFGAPIARRLGWARTFVSLTFVATLLGLGLANIALRATWHEVEDGVLWVTGPQGVTAAEVAPGTRRRPGGRPARRRAAGHRRPARRAALGSRSPSCTRNRPARVFATRCCGCSRPRWSASRWRRCLGAPRPSTSCSPPSGIFTLLVGAGVRYRRHSDEATLHFFWLCLAFFGAITFSFNGRLDRLDWFFYWTDVVSILLLPPLFLHFTLVFPERPRSWVRTPMGRTFLPLLYLPAALLGLARVVAIARSPLDAKYFIGVVAALDRFEPLYLSICLAAGLVILIRAFGHVRSVTARRQLRWIVWGTALGALPFALGYAVPYAFGVEPSLPMELSAIPLSFVPLAFASAIVRYRLMDVEVILKRMLVWAVAIAAILGLYAVLLNVATEGFSGNGANPQLGHRAAGDGRGRAAGQPGEERDSGRRSTAPSIAIATTTAGRWSGLRATSTPTSISTAWPSGSSRGSWRRCWSIAWCCSWPTTAAISRRCGSPASR